MHHAGLLSVIGGSDGRFEGKIYTLGYGKGIHVGTKGHHRSRLASSKDTYHASYRYIFSYFHTQRAQVSGDDFGSAYFLISQFRVLVKIPSPFDDFGFYPLGFLINAGTKFGLTKGSSGNQE
jgi:hypothetical protein